MELLALVKDLFQSAAEYAASYRLGQTVLRYLDRSLWVVEKCARWAVPPPLDQDERPPPELVRPLPWVFFLAMIMTLRVVRESISLVNLVMGKPPLRSADVVMYIQSKRRYLRTLKYQGNRMMRTRTSTTQETQSWTSSLGSLFEFTMCFRRQTHYGNNNTTSVSNNDEVLVVRRSKRGREHSSPVASTSETTMERLIEKMVDLYADSDDDASFTLTNVTSVRSDRSDFTADSDQELVVMSEGNEVNSNQQNNEDDTMNAVNNSENTLKSDTDSTVNVQEESTASVKSSKSSNSEKTVNSHEYRGNKRRPENSHTKTPHNTSASSYSDVSEVSQSTPDKSRLAVYLSKNTAEDEKKTSPDTSPTKIPRTSSYNEQKIVNGRTVNKKAPSKRKGSKNTEKDRRSSTEVYVGVSGNSAV